MTERMLPIGHEHNQLFKEIADNLSPDAVAMVICLLRAAESGNKPTDKRALIALSEVEWLADELTNMLGVKVHDQLIDELGL